MLFHGETSGRGTEWIFAKRGSQKILAWSQNQGNICDRSQSLAFGWLCISESQNVFLVSNFETWVLQSHNVLNLPFYTLSGTLRTESPSIFLDKSGRVRNLCRHPRQFFLSMLQIQIFLRHQSNRYRSIHCVCFLRGSLRCKGGKVKKGPLLQILIDVVEKKYKIQRSFWHRRSGVIHKQV